MKKLIKSTLLAGALLMASSLQAVIVVDLNGENMNTNNDGGTLGLSFSGSSSNTATANYDGGAGTADYARSRTFTSPGSASYTAQAFTGTMIAASYNSGSALYDPSSGNIGIRDLAPSSDALNLRAGTNGAAGSGISIYQIGFAQADWATLNTGNVGFDNSSAFNISGINGSHSEAWLMVVAGGTSYVATTSGSIADLSAANFNSYDNRATLDNALWDSGSGTTVAGSALSNITEVGLYIEIDVANTSSANGLSNFAQFDIGAVAVPEPSTFALLGIACVALIGLRRFNR